MARDDAHAVMHLHTEAGVAVSCMKGGLLPLNQTALFICDDVAQHEYEGVALHLEERERLTADLGRKNAMLLWNHGTLALGGSVPECFMRLYYLERACAIQVKALAGGGLHLPSQQSIDATISSGRCPAPHISLHSHGRHYAACSTGRIAAIKTETAANWIRVAIASACSARRRSRTTLSPPAPK